MTRELFLEGLKRNEGKEINKEEVMNLIDRNQEKHGSMRLLTIAAEELNELITELHKFTTHFTDETYLSALEEVADVLLTQKYAYKSIVGDHSYPWLYEMDRQHRYFHIDSHDLLEDKAINDMLKLQKIIFKKMRCQDYKEEYIKQLDIVMKDISDLLILLERDAGYKVEAAFLTKVDRLREYLNTGE